MPTVLEHPEYLPDPTHHLSTYTPEFLAVAGLMRRREQLNILAQDLLRQEKITQIFLRRFMEETLDAWYDLEEKCELALKACGNHAQETREALIKAENALKTTEVVLEMGKILSANLGDTSHS